MSPMPWAEVLAGRLLNGLPAGVAIALAAWMVLRLAGGKNSSTRFAVWFAALLAIGISPVLGGVMATGVGRTPAVTVPGSWAAALLGVWAVIALAGLVRVAIGLHGLQRLRARHRTAEVIDPELLRAMREFGVSRKVTLAISEEVRVPTAIGFWKPMVILPAWAVKELSAEELKAILIHELAHLKRWDDCTNLAQKVIRALFFFNPAVLWLESRLSLEREMACDDAVLARTENPRAYAECLVAVAEKSLVRRGMAMAQAAVSRIGQTSRRVSQILDGEKRGAARVWRPAVAMGVVFAAGCAVTLSRAPELVGFEDAQPAAVASSALEAVSHTMVVPASYKVPEKAAVPIAVHKKAVRRQPAVKLARRDPVRTQTVVFVVQTSWTGEDLNRATFSEYGAPMPSWTLCFWRVTVVNAAQMAPVPAKSI